MGSGVAVKHGSYLTLSVWLQGLGNNSGDYQKLELTLRSYGVATVVAKVSRPDWLRNAAGLLQSDYWRGTLRPRPVLDWYSQTNCKNLFYRVALLSPCYLNTSIGLFNYKTSAFIW